MGAWAHASDANVKMTRPIASSRLCPKMSPSEPAVSSTTVRVSVYASTTHCSSANEGSSDSAMSGSATATIVTSSSSMNEQMTTAASVHHLRVPDSAVSSATGWLRTSLSLEGCGGSVGRGATSVGRDPGRHGRLRANGRGLPSTGSVSSMIVKPTWIRSPPTRLWCSTTRSPLTNVPFVEWRSSIQALPSCTVTLAWRRETSGSCTRRSLPSSRPIVALPCTVVDSPAPGPLMIFSVPSPSLPVRVGAGGVAGTNSSVHAPSSTLSPARSA